MGYSMAVNLWQSSIITGQAISAAVLTPFSDTAGRKPMLLLCMLGGAALTAVKYFCGFLRHFKADERHFKADERHYNAVFQVSLPK